MITVDPITTQFVLVLVFSISLGLMGYKEYAHSQGWAVGSWAYNMGNWTYIFSVIGLVGSLIFSVWKIGWISLLITLGAGVVLAFILVSLLRAHFQWLAVLLPFLVFGFALIKVE